MPDLPVGTDALLNALCGCTTALCRPGEGTLTCENGLVATDLVPNIIFFRGASWCAAVLNR